MDMDAALAWVDKINQEQYPQVVMTPNVRRLAARAVFDAVQRLEFFASWVIENRACVCNKPYHRCGTNQMLEDLWAQFAQKS